MFIISVFAAQQNLIYDANGNLVTGDGKYREYNVFNQLVKVRQGNSSSGKLIEEYIYDPVEEKVLVKRDYINTSNEVKRFVLYINDNFIREYGSSAGPLNDTYYAKDDSGIVGEVRYNGSQNSPKLTKSRKLYYHNDLKTSVSVLTNDSGAVVEQTFYEPYGKILSGGAKERFSYENKEYTPQINTYDFHFRQYQPDWNKFTQPDTVFQNLYDPQLLNRYTFERNNPCNQQDSTGHCPWCIAASIGFMVGSMEYMSTHSGSGWSNVINTYEAGTITAAEYGASFAFATYAGRAVATKGIVGILTAAGNFVIGSGGEALSEAQDDKKLDPFKITASGLISIPGGLKPGTFIGTSSAFKIAGQQMVSQIASSVANQIIDYTEGMIQDSNPKITRFSSGYEGNLVSDMQKRQTSSQAQGLKSSGFIQFSNGFSKLAKKYGINT